MGVRITDTYILGLIRKTRIKHSKAMTNRLLLNLTKTGALWLGDGFPHKKAAHKARLFLERVT